MTLQAGVFKVLKACGFLTLIYAGWAYAAVAWAQTSGQEAGNDKLVVAKAETAEQQQLPTAVQWYLEMAKNGDADAQYNLGSVYETGFGVQPDLDEAVRWYKEAATNDHTLAQLKLGILYILGQGTRKSLIKGTSWIQSASDNGSQFADELYNKVLAPDIVLEMSAEEVVKKVKPFIDLGEKKSIAKLEGILKKAEQKSKKKQPELAERFTGKSKNTLGKEVDIKNDVPEFLDKNNKGHNLKNSNLALLQREANAGNPEAQFQLGRLYDTGTKLDRDRQKAITWYTSAANQGHAESQYRLAVAYLFGIGARKNPTLGESWLAKSAKQNHPVAKELLPIYKANQAGNRSISIAVTWYLEKIAEGESDGGFGLGYMYEKGWGIRPDNSAARTWYTEARSIGSGGAARRLRQFKAEKASHDPDPSAESRPKMPDNTQSRAVNTRAGAEAIPARNETSSSFSAARQLIDEIDDSGSTFVESVARRSTITPVILILFGVVMGITVFKWMRRGNYKKSVF
ncbi:MAG: tetratricopeptide repeat protein [Gammaproteobacteria bacterium]|jgi:hypothetical protein